MPCDVVMRMNVTKEELAEAGLSPEEIHLLEVEVKLAREKAKADAYSAGKSLRQQEADMVAAEKAARKRVSQLIHAKLDTMMDQIRQMGAAKKLPVGAHAGEDDEDA